MAYDYILGVGKIVGRQPANLIAESSNIIASTGSDSATITFGEPVEVLFVSATINFKLAVGAADSKPICILKRNGQELDRVQYESNFNQINAGSVDKLLYSTAGQKIDFVSRGDTYSIHLDTEGGTVGTIQTFLTINVVGRYV